MPLFPIPSASRPGIEAEVQCQRCKKKRWVDFEDRWAGAEKPPAGIDPSPRIRCPHCMTGTDWTRPTGNVRPK